MTHVIVNHWLAENAAFWGHGCYFWNCRLRSILDQFCGVETRPHARCHRGRKVEVQVIVTSRRTPKLSHRFNPYLLRERRCAGESLASQSTDAECQARKLFVPYLWCWYDLAGDQTPTPSLSQGRQSTPKMPWLSEFMHHLKPIFNMT